MFIVLKASAFRFIGKVARVHFDQCGISLAQGERVTVDHHLYRVAKGREFHQFDHCIRDETHVQEVLSALAFAIHRLDACGLTYFKLSECCHFASFDGTKVQITPQRYHPY